MAQSVQVNTKALVVAIAAGVLIVYAVYRWTANSVEASDKSKPGGGLVVHDTWKPVKLEAIPNEIVNGAANIKVEERRLTFNADGKVCITAIDTI